MTIEGLQEFEDNLKKVSDFTKSAVVTAMQIAESRVMKSAKASHNAPPPDGGHPDKRYYDRTAELTNSIRIGETVATANGIKGEVLAGNGSNVGYAAAVEFGTPKTRAYPFMQPALDDNADAILLIFAEAVKQVIK